jgi:hypothetical protein
LNSSIVSTKHYRRSFGPRIMNPGWNEWPNLWGFHDLNSTSNKSTPISGARKRRNFGYGVCSPPKVSTPMLMINMAIAGCMFPLS